MAAGAGARAEPKRAARDETSLDTIRAAGGGSGGREARAAEECARRREGGPEGEREGVDEGEREGRGKR